MIASDAERPRTVKKRSNDPPVILVVDDAALTVALVTRILRAEGFRTLGAAHASEALALCAKERVDLILLDVIMPDQSGFQLCRDLKSKPETSEIPVIFLSELDDVESRTAGLNMGGVDYIAKPFHAEEVLARVRVHLRIRRAAQSLVREQNARLEELRQAQQSILVDPADLPEASFAVYYRPADAVGGDIYDVAPFSDDLISYFVADISGHGVRASFLTSAVKAALRQYSSPEFSAEDTMRGINTLMRAMLDPGQYLTACYARLYKRRRSLTVVGAGHPPLILASNFGSTACLAAESDPLGVFGSVVFEKQEICLESGDRFYLYTDGLIENPGSPGGGRSEGIERLRTACARRQILPLEEAVPAIAVDAAGNGVPNDDLLLLGVEVRE